VGKRGLPLRAYLDKHEVRTASEQSRATFKNGDLLTAAEAAGFEVLLTTAPQRNLPYGNITVKRLEFDR
jgi:hypothetical protein